MTMTMTMTATPMSVPRTVSWEAMSGTELIARRCERIVRFHLARASDEQQERCATATHRHAPSNHSHGVSPIRWHKLTQIRQRTRKQHVPCQPEPDEALNRAGS